jgi:hypothetical protein
MKPFLRVLCCASLIASSTAFAADMTPEEHAVRVAYAKLIFAIQVQTVEQSLHQSHRKLKPGALESALQKNQLHIELSDFSSGDIAEITNRDIQKLVTLPHGEEVLSISGASYSFKDRDGKVTEETTAGIPSWTPGPSIGKGDVSSTLSEVLAVNQPSDIFDRYAMFNVAVSFQGRTRKYRALALFGKDSKGADKVLFTDTVVGAGPQDMTIHSVYPAVLLESSEGEVPAVMDWFTSNQMPVSACTSGARDVCCDPSTLKCGISTDVLKRSTSYAALHSQSAEN